MTKEVGPDFQPNATRLTAYLAADGFLPQLVAEVQRHGKIIATYDQLLLVEGSPQPAYWAQNTWYDPRRLNVASIGDAAKQLKGMQRSWWPYSFQLHRRTSLIQEQLPKVRCELLTFPTALRSDPLGSYCLLDDKTVLASPRCRSRLPNGDAAFVEQKIGPPSRAYLKLWEALTRAGIHPAPGEKCLELGASPGGWTWVVASLGADVLAIDRAPLAPAIQMMREVSFEEGDAFNAKPDKIGPIDWLFSDVICYPEKLYEFVQLWLNAKSCTHFVCTLKFQGEGHYDIIRAFAEIPLSHVLHLSYNKHELTWICSRKPLDIA